jgi:small subunit ribosomal protein S9
MTKEKLEEYLGTGRRKRAVASVRLRPGAGKINVNGKEFDVYFPSDMQRRTILEPLKLANKEGHYDIVIRATGGGVEGQATATRLGISRALVQQNESLRPTFKAEGFMTRDPRRKERKKYGLRKARKSTQFSKR